MIDGREHLHPNASPNLQKSPMQYRGMTVACECGNCPRNKEMRMTIILTLGAIIIGALLYIRLAPSNVAHWHVDLTHMTAPKSSGVLRDLKATSLADVHKVAAATERTQVLAGTVEAGKITYITRSAVFGFPDYTTVQTLPSGGVRIFARLRFGKSDFGVNAARIDMWQAVLGT